MCAGGGGGDSVAIGRCCVYIRILYLWGLVYCTYGPQTRTVEVSREGPFDAYAATMNTEDSPLVTTGLPGCPYRITSYTGPAVADSNPAFGLQIHHPRFLEFIGAPEFARLLYHSPTFWVQWLGEEDAMAAAVNLQWDAGLMSSNLQIFRSSLRRCIECPPR